MNSPSPKSLALTVLAYIGVSFAVQAASHFGINAGHYRAISIMRADPIIPLGILSMVIQGLVFGLLFPGFNRGGSAIRNGVLFSWALGSFLASYIVLAEPGKYTVPSVPGWMAVEASAALVQYTLFGVLLGLVHSSPARSAPSL